MKSLVFAVSIMLSGCVNSATIDQEEAIPQEIVVKILQQYIDSRIEVPGFGWCDGYPLPLIDGTWTNGGAPYDMQVCVYSL